MREVSKLEGEHISGGKIPVVNLPPVHVSPDPPPTQGGFGGASGGSFGPPPYSQPPSTIGIGAGGGGGGSCSLQAFAKNVDTLVHESKQTPGYLAANPQFQAKLDQDIFAAASIYAGLATANACAEEHYGEGIGSLVANEIETTISSIGSVIGDGADAVDKFIDKAVNRAYQIVENDIVEWL